MLSIHMYKKHVLGANSVNNESHRNASSYFHIISTQAQMTATFLRSWEEKKLPLQYNLQCRPTKFFIKFHQKKIVQLEE